MPVVSTPAGDDRVAIQLGFKFRRQRPIGRSIVDFYCAEANLIIEIDGDSHAPPDQADYDAARTRWLEERGYRVIRFSAGHVEDDLAGVVCPSLCSGCFAKGILKACEAETGGDP